MIAASKDDIVYEEQKVENHQQNLDTKVNYNAFESVELKIVREIEAIINYQTYSIYKD